MQLRDRLVPPPPKPQTIPFDALPAEITNRIFHLTLVEENALHLSKTNKQTWEIQTFKKSEIKTDEDGATVLDEDEETEGYAEPLRPRQRTPILYGANNLVISLNCFEAFLYQIGPSRKYLRHLGINEISAEDDLERALVDLAHSARNSALPVLQKLTLTRCADPKIDFIRPAQLVKIVLPFLKALQKAQKRSVGDVVHVVEPPQWDNESAGWNLYYASYLAWEVEWSFQALLRRELPPLLEDFGARHGAGREA